MSTVAPAPKKSSLHGLAVVLSSLVIGLPLLMGRVVEAILDTINPAGVDVSQPLAYLTEILGFAFGSVGVLLLVIIVILAILYRRAKTLDAIALPLVVLAVQIVVGVVTLLLTGLIDS